MQIAAVCITFKVNRRRSCIIKRVDLSVISGPNLDQITSTLALYGLCENCWKLAKIGDGMVLTAHQHACVGEINMERDELSLTHFAYQSDFDSFVCCPVNYARREFMVET